MKECPKCNGTGTAKSGNNCPACKGQGKVSVERFAELQKIITEMYKKNKSRKSNWVIC